jgi:hypothetical protein
MANCHDLFLEFYDKIVLPETKKETLRKARDAIRDRDKWGQIFILDFDKILRSSIKKLCQTIGGRP